MVSLLVAGAAFFLYLALAIFLYQWLAARISRKALSFFSAVAIYWLVLAATPWVLMWFGFRIGGHIYQSFPAVREAAWDVGLALTVYIGMFLSYIVGAVSGCVAPWFLASRSRVANGTSAT